MASPIYLREHQVLVRLLRELREKSGTQQIEMAERLGRPQSFVSRYESGQRRLDVVELRQICEVLGLDLLQFVRRFEKELARSQ